MPPELNVKINGDATGLSNALGTASGAVGKFGLALNTLKAHPVLLVISAVAALGAVAADTAKAGLDAAAAEEKFANSMSRLGVEAANSNAAINAAITAGQALAFSDDATRNSIVTLTTATGNLDDALGLLSTAQDVARLANVDLETASDAVAKAQAGQDMALKRLIPGMHAGATAADTIAEAQRLAAGSADTYAKSAEGMGEVAVDSFGEMQESIGQELVPMMMDLLAELMPIVAQITKLAIKVMPPFIAAVKLLAGPLKIALNVLSGIVDIILQLIDVIGDVMKPIQDLIDAIGQIKMPSFDLPSFSLPFSATPEAAGRSAGASQQSTGATGGGVTINIYGDPSVIEARVTKALRDYARRNGMQAVFSTARTR